jgi:CheY-like chemotaxis protein
MLEQRPFDVALLDVQMPELDGFELTARIREREASTGVRLPIIAMTARAMKGDRERCFRAGMDGYIAKPVQAGELIDAVERFVFVSALAKSPPLDAVQQAMDKQAALARVQGDYGLFAEIGALFLKECPKLLSRIERAIDSGNCRDLERAAHTLKGSVANFCAQGAVDAALELELMGRNQDLQGVRQAFSTLEREIHRLIPELVACCS